MASPAEKLQHRIAWTVILAESSHVFCCVLPTIVTLISLLSSVGLIAQVPVVILDIHEALHAYEIPIIAFSGGMMVLGWILYAISRYIECAVPHCEPHETVCTPQKSNAHIILTVASIIFLINITVYFTVHVHMAGLMHQDAVAAHAHDHDADHADDHDHHH